MTPDEILEEINELEEEIENLRKEYYSIVEPCSNKDCAFYDEKYPNAGRCKWTHEITKCNNYIPEGGTNGL